MNKITVETIVDATIEKVWECWNEPQHIKGWAFASDDWEAIPVENDLRVGGKFNTRMQSKDKSTGFDFLGTYMAVEENKLVEYNMNDGRHIKTLFEEVSQGIKVTQIFDPETENSEDFQRTGWQAFLDNFKKYVEAV